MSSSLRSNGAWWSWRWLSLRPSLLEPGLGSGVPIYRIDEMQQPGAEFIQSWLFLAHFHSSPAPQNPNITSNPNNIHVAQYILNDTSLAALSLSNGDRHLFFQDNTGLIRRVVRTASNNKWSMSQGVSVLSNAKKYTPLAVIFVGSAAEVQIKCIVLTQVDFYVDCVILRLRKPCPIIHSWWFLGISLITELQHRRRYAVTVYHLVGKHFMDHKLCHIYSSSALWESSW